MMWDLQADWVSRLDVQNLMVCLKIGNMNEATPYPELNHVLRELADTAREVLGTTFVGTYLQGSFAVGDFDQHSDVDFIMVIEEEPSDDQIQALQVMHERVYGLESRWAQHLEGSYFPQDVLRQQPEPGKKLWYLDNGARSLIKSDHCNTNVVRWVVRENGVVLAGPPPKTLIDLIPVETLRMEILGVITGWGQEIIEQPEPFKNRFYQTFIVLNFCRMLHDLYRGYPGSKLAGAEWAKTNLDPSWTGLIDRAWDGRPNPAQSVREPADAKDFDNTLKLVSYIINESNLYAGKSM